MNQQINLYRDADKRPRKPVDSLHIAAAAVLTVVVLAGLTAHGWWRATQLEREVETVSADHDELAARVDRLTAEVRDKRDEQVDPERADRLRAELEAKRNLLDYLQDGPLAERTGFSDHVEGLARRVVDDLWLSSIRLSEGGRKLRLHGHALAPERVPELITALGEEPAYAGHTFQRLRIERPEDQPGQVNFELASVPGDDAATDRSRR